MARYTIRRILQMIPLMLGISLILFLIIQAAPGGPEGIMLQSGMMIDPSVIEAYRHRLGVDQPIYIQYFKWIFAALSGDLGFSFQTSRPVAAMIMERIPATLELMSVSFLLAALDCDSLRNLQRLAPIQFIRSVRNDRLILGDCNACFLVWPNSSISFFSKTGMVARSWHGNRGRHFLLGPLQTSYSPNHCALVTFHRGLVVLYALEYVRGYSIRLYSHGPRQGLERKDCRFPSCSEKRPHSGHYHYGARSGGSFLRGGHHRNDFRLAWDWTVVCPIHVCP